LLVPLGKIPWEKHRPGEKKKKDTVGKVLFSNRVILKSKEKNGFWRRLLLTKHSPSASISAPKLFPGLPVSQAFTSAGRGKGTNSTVAIIF
jgi:hypothetical protein